jgi:hypothetical protein
MKTLFNTTGSLLLFAFVISSCAKRLGDLTMISTRNVDSKTEYVELKRYVKGKGKDLETAIEKAVKEVPGGEFMKNVTVFYSGKIKVEGDVWGKDGILSNKEKKQEQKKTEQELADEKKAEEKRMEEERKTKELEELRAKFNIGDKVSWKHQLTMKIITGTISGKDDDKAVIKTQTDSGEKLVKVAYSQLTKIEQHQ